MKNDNELIKVLTNDMTEDPQKLLKYAVYASKELLMGAGEEKELNKYRKSKRVRSGKEGTFIVSELFPDVYWSRISLSTKLILGTLYWECVQDPKGALNGVIEVCIDKKTNLPVKTLQRQQLYIKK